MTAKEAPVTEDRTRKMLPIVLLFMLMTILFNTIRANRVISGNTDFNKATRYELAAAREALSEQQRINAHLQEQIDRLAAAQAPAPAVESQLP